MAYWFTDHANGLDTNDGKDQYGLDVSIGNWTNSSGTLTRTGKFGSVAVGGILYLASAGLGKNGWYEITSIAGAPNTVICTLVLGDGLGANAADVTSSDGPFQTLQKAMDMVGAGDKAWVQAGEAYNDDGQGDGSTVCQIITVGTMTLWIVFEAFKDIPGDADSNAGDTNYIATVNATSKTYGVERHASTTGQCYTFKHIKVTLADDSGWYHNGRTFTRFIDCDAFNNGGRGFDLNQAVVDDCRASDNSLEGIYAGSVSTLTGGVYKNNTDIQVTVGNYTSFVDQVLVYGLGTNGIGINVPGHATLGAETVARCTIDGTGDTGTTGIKSTLSSVHTANNIIKCNTPVDANLDFGEGVTTNNNMFIPSSGLTKYSVGVDHVETSDPGWIDQPSGDYRLASDSPARAAGYPEFADIGALQSVSLKPKLIIL